MRLEDVYNTGIMASYYLVLLRRADSELAQVEGQKAGAKRQ